MSFMKWLLPVFYWKNFVLGWSVFWRGILAPVFVFFFLVFGINKVLNDMSFAAGMRSNIIILLLVSLLVAVGYSFNRAVKSVIKQKGVSVEGKKYLWWFVLWRWTLALVGVNAVIQPILYLAKSVILGMVLGPVLLYCSLSVLGWAVTMVIVKLSSLKEELTG